MLAFLKKEFSPAFEKLFLGFLLFSCLFLSLTLNFTHVWYQQFIYLADSFLHGQLHFRELPDSYVDLAWYEGKFYWHLGPFPAILLAPFVLFWGTDFLQGYVQFLLTILNFYLLYRIALELGIKEKIGAYWLAFGYIFGTMYLGIAFNTSSWRFAQAVATTLILLAIFEYLRKKRFWLIGIYTALLLATRMHLILGLPFFILGILYEKVEWSKKLTSLARLALPVFIVSVLLLWYDYARFGDFFETGYSFGPYFNSLIGNTDSLRIALDYTGGKLFSLAYVPTNLYYFFFKGLDPTLLTQHSYILSPPFARLGNFAHVSFIVSAPLFFLALLANIREKLVRQSWLAAGSIFFVLLFFFAPEQRYFLDIAPFLFIPLVRACAPTVSFPVKTFIFLSFGVNFFLQSLRV